jgi:hypothetical protein
MSKHEFISIFPQGYHGNMPSNEVSQEATTQEEEIVLSSDYLNSKIKEIKVFGEGLGLSLETLAEAEKEVRMAIDSYKKRILSDVEKMKNAKTSAKLIAQFKNFAAACFDQDVEKIKASLQKQKNESFLKNFLRTDQKKQEATEEESVEYLFSFLSERVGDFELKVETKLNGCFDKKTIEELSQKLIEVGKKRRNIEKKYRTSLSHLKDVQMQMDDENELTSVGITSVKFTAINVLRQDIKDLEKWIDDELVKLVKE